MPLENNLTWYNPKKSTLIVSQNQCAIERDGFVIYNDSDFEQKYIAAKICQAYGLEPVVKRYPFRIVRRYYGDLIFDLPKKTFQVQNAVISLDLTFNTRNIKKGNFILDIKDLQDISEKAIRLFTKIFNEFFDSSDEINKNQRVSLDITNFIKYEKYYNKIIKDFKFIPTNTSFKNLVISNRKYGKALKYKGILDIKQMTYHILGMNFSNNQDIYPIMENILKCINEYDKLKLLLEENKLRSIQ